MDSAAPWRFDPNFGCVRDSRDRVLWDVDVANVPSEREKESLGHLIAAAPDLYRLLEKACEDLGGRDQLNIAFIDEMEGALAKARGEK